MRSIVEAPYPGAVNGAKRGIAAAALLVALLATWSPQPAAASGPQWKTAKLPGLAGELFLLSVSCPSSSLCVATGTQNLIASSTNPSGDAGAWDVLYAGDGFYNSPFGPVISSRQVQGVSCPTTRLCVAVTTLGQIYSTTNGCRAPRRSNASGSGDTA